MLMKMYRVTAGQLKSTAQARNMELDGELHVPGSQNEKAVTFMLYHR